MTEEELAKSPVIRMAGSDGETYEATADLASEMAAAAREAGVALKPFVKTTDAEGNLHEISPFDGAALKEAEERGDERHFEGNAEADYFSAEALKAGAARFAIGLVNPWDWLRGIGTAAGTVVRGLAKGTVGTVLKAAQGATYLGESIGNAITGSDDHALSEGIGKVNDVFEGAVDAVTPDLFELTGEYDGVAGAKEATGAVRGVAEMVANVKGIGKLTKLMQSGGASARAAHAMTGAMFGAGKYGDVASDPNGPGGWKQQAAAIAAGTADAVIFGLWNPFKISAKYAAELKPFAEATRREVTKRVLVRLGQAFESGASMATVEAVKQGAEQLAGIGMDGASGGSEPLPEDETTKTWGERTLAESAKEVGAQFLVGSAFAAIDVAEANIGRFSYNRARKAQGDLSEGMKVAMSYQVERNRKAICPKYHEQASYAYNMFVNQGGRAQSFKDGFSMGPDVRRINEDGSVVFDDGSVWRPDPRTKSNGAYWGATITVSDGTILSETGELLGYRARRENGITRAEPANQDSEKRTLEERADEISEQVKLREEADAGTEPRHPESGEKAESNALLLLQQIDEGKLPVEEVAIGDVEAIAPTENGNFIEEYDAAKAKPIVVWEDLEGNRHAVTGGKRLLSADASGAETIKAVVVREADGWSEADARGLGATENLREGHGTIKNVVDAVGTLGADKVAELAGWHQANGSRDFASTLRKGLAVAQKGAPELKAALAEGRIGDDFAYNAAQVLSMERVGEGWEAAQRELAELIGKVGPEELEAVLWGLKGRLTTDGASGGPEPLPKEGATVDWKAAIAEERAKYNAKKGGADGKLDSDAVLMETEDNELKTLGEVEAENSAASGEAQDTASGEVEARSEEASNPKGVGRAEVSPRPDKVSVREKIKDFIKGLLPRKDGTVIKYKESDTDTRRITEEATKAYNTYASKEYKLPTGGVLYFAPDARTVEAYGGDVGAAWGEYALHLVTHRRGKGDNLYRSFDGSSVDKVLPKIEEIIAANQVKVSDGRIVFFMQTVDGGSKNKSRYACLVTEPDANGNLRVDLRYVTGMQERGFLPGETVTLEEAIRNRTAEGRALHPDQPATGSRSNTASAQSPESGSSIPNNSLRVNEVEAPELAAAQGAAENKAVELRPAGDKPGVFTTLSHPEARFTVDGETRTVAVDGLTEADFEPGRIGQTAALVAKVEAYAANNLLKIGFRDDGVQQLWETVRENIKAEGREAYSAAQVEAKRKTVIDRLLKSFPDAEVIEDGEKFREKYEQMQGVPLANDEGVYAFVDPKTKKVYLDPQYFGTKQGLESPIHEFGHLGVIACEKVNRAVYDQGMKLAKELLKGSGLRGAEPANQDGGLKGLVDFVNEYYGDFSPELRAQELLAQLVGKRGEEALRAESNKSVVAKVKAWLVKYWNTFGKALGLKDITPEEAAKMTVEDVADAIRAEMLSGRKYGEGLDRVEFSDGGARVRTKPARIKRRLTGRRKAVNDFVAKMGGAEDPANTETDLLALWVDNGGRLFDKIPYEVETGYSKGKSGVKLRKSSVADEFAESTAFYKDLNAAQRKVYFGTEKLEHGAIGGTLVEKLDEAGITRFTKEDGTVDYNALIGEFERQWTNYERGEAFLKERGEWEEEHDRAIVEEMERAEAAEREAEAAAGDEASAAEAEARAAAEAAGVMFSRAVGSLTGGKKNGRLSDVDQKRLTAVMRGLGTGELKHPRFTTEEFAASKGTEHEQLWNYILSLESPDLDGGGAQAVARGEGGANSKGSERLGRLRRVATRYGRDPKEIAAADHKYFDRGAESRVYDTGEGTVIKVRRLDAYDMDGVKHALAKIVYHNYLFPKDAYRLHDIAVWKNGSGRDEFYMILEQPMVTPKRDANGNIIEPSQGAIFEALKKTGQKFNLTGGYYDNGDTRSGSSSSDVVESAKMVAANGDYAVYDFKPGRNTFIDAETGEVRFIDPRIDINDPTDNFAYSKFGKRRRTDAWFDIEAQTETARRQAEARKNASEGEWTAEDESRLREQEEAAAALEDEDFDGSPSGQGGRGLLFSRAVKPSKLGDGKQRYYEVKFEDAVDKIVKAKKPVSDEHVFVSETPKPFADIGFAKLPVMMGQGHVISCYFGEGEGVEGKHLHKMKGNLKLLPKALEKPLMIITSETSPSDSVVAILKMKDNTGASVIVPVKMSGVGRVGKDLVDAHIALTMFGKKNAWKSLVANAIEKEANGEVGVFYIDGTESKTILERLGDKAKGLGISGLQSPSETKTSAFNFGRTKRQLLRRTKGTVHSIADAGSPVKGGIVSQTATRQFKNWFAESKVVDANGEPLVVYRGAEFDPLAQESGKGVIMPEAYFTADPEYAKRYTGNGGKVHAYYLNIRNPFDIRDPECLKDLQKIYPDHEFQRGKSGALDWGEASIVDGEFIKENFGDKYDGIIYDEGGDPTDGGPTHRGISYVPLDGGAQVKSATDNIGTFDPGNNDIRFSRGGKPPEAEHVKLTRVADDAGQGEQTPGAMAASRELSRQGAVPINTKGTRYVSLPMSEMNALARYLTGHALPAEMESGRKLGAAGKASYKHRKLTIAADVLGVVDKTDMAAEKAFLKQHGFFAHEDSNWCATHSPAEVRKERDRSEEALAGRLEKIADKRIAGREPGGMAAGRKVFADQLAKVVMAMPHGQPGALGAMQTVAGALEKRVRGSETEAETFLDWMEGVAPGGAGRPARSGQERKAGMFAAFLIMPKEMEARAKGWYDAIRSTIAGDQKLADAFRKMTARMMSEQGYAHLESEILRMQDAQTEAAIKKLQAEANEPIKAGGKLDQAKETVVLSCDDRMGAAVVRVDAAAKVYLAAQKRLMAAAKTPAEKAQTKQQTDVFMGQLAQAKNQAELSRTAWERGRNNADARYLWRMVDLLNEATVRDGLRVRDLSLYLDQMRVIETRGLSGSRGESARQAQLIIDAMRKRLGADFAKVEAFARRFHAIHEQELLNNPLLEKILGKGTADYWRSQTSYVTTKRTFSPEELAEIEAARRVLAASGAAGGDTVVGQMFKYCGRPEATAKLKGSFADKQEVMSATFEKVAEVQRFLRRSEYVIRLRDMLKLANVEGVHDMPAGKNEFKSNNRYGSISYMENGQKRTLVVPREIADGFDRQSMYNSRALKICASVNNIARQLWIDWNPVYWHRNLSRNAGSIEMNMPGMRESIIKRGARFVFPGLAPVTEMAMTHLVRHLPERMSLGLRKIWGEHTALYYAPKAKRMAMWLTDHSEMQRRLWEAEKRGDLGAVQEMEEDRRDMLAALRANMLVGISAGKASGTAGFLDDSVKTVGKTMQREMQDWKAKSKFRKVLDTVNIFSKNAEQQVFEDIMAKFSAYLHDRAQFGTGNNRTAEESGLVVKKNVSIGEGERNGETAGITQAIFQPFWNMVEKGVVRNVKAYKERPAETFGKAAWRIAPMLLQGLIGSGAVAAWILKSNDNDEEKVKNGPMGDVYRYLRDAQRAYQNCSNYVRNNYHVTPLWTDEYTSIVIGMPLTDEERLLKPIARFVADAASVASGTKESLDVSGFLSDATGVIAPDFKIAGALPTLLDDTVHAFWENPEDYYTGGQKYDKDTWALRNESWEMRGKFTAAMAKRLWNDFGGRNVLPVDRAGVDNGLGRAPGWVAKMVNDIPVASPILRSFVKVQVGSPKRDAAEITEAEARRRAVCRVCAKELFETAHKAKGDISLDQERYNVQLQKWKARYDLTDEELADIEGRYLNAWRSYEGAQYRADGEREKYRAKAERLGLDAAHIWLDFD